MTCPNLSISPYKELVEQYGPGAANAVSVLLDSAAFQQWYGSPNLPEINNLQIVNSKGESYDVGKFLSERKKLVEQENGLGKSYQNEGIAQQVAEVFNSTNDRAKQYEAVVVPKMSGFVTKLEWRKEVKENVPSDIVFSQAPQQSTQQVTDSQSEFQQMLDKLKVNIQERIDRKRKQLTNLNEGRYAKAVAELDRLLKSLESIDGASAVSKVIDEVHSKLLADKGVVTQVTKLAEELEKGLADKSLSQEQMLEKITRLREFQQYVKDFSSLQDFYHLLPANVDKTDPNSPQRKLDEVNRAQQKVQEVYQKAVAPLSARLLLPFLSPAGAKAAAALNASLRAIERRLVIAQQKEDAPAIARLEKQKKSKLLALSQAVGDEQALIDLLHATTKDVGVLEYLFGTTTGSVDAVLSTFSLFVKDFYTKLDQKMQRVGMEALSRLDTYHKATGKSKGDPAKFNEGLYEVLNNRGKKTLHFVQEIDWNSYWKEQAKMELAIAGLAPAEAYEQRAIWYSQNKEPIAQEEIDKRKLEKTTQLTNGIITQEEYDEWYADTHRMNYVTNKIEYKGELSQPKLKKYINGKWLELNRPENAAKKAYYDYLRGLQTAADELLPVERRLGTRLPNIRQGLTDNMLQGTLTKELLWERLKGNFASDEYADELTYGVEGDVVPVKFTGHMDADNVSRDLLSSVLLFTQAAETYKQNTQLLPFAQTIQDTIKDRDIQQTDGNGEKLMRAGANKLGLKVEAIKGEGGNAYKLLNHFIESILLGKEADKVKWGPVDIGKTVGAVMGLASKTQIGGPFNWLKSATNWMSAEISIGLEAFAGDFLDVKAWGRGKKLAATYLASGDALKDFSKPQSTSLTGQLIDYWSPIPEGFKDKFGREISTSDFRRHASMGTWFLGSKLGEMTAQYGMFLGMLSDIKVPLNGKMIPATEAYELDEKGQLKLKDGVEWSEEDQRRFKNRIDALSKRLHGVYNDFDKSVVTKHSVFRLITMYKKFLEPGIKRRFAGHGIDQEMNAELEGYYRTLGRNLLTDWKETVDAIWSGKDYKGEVLTPLEVKNLQNAARELAFTLILMTVAAVLAGLGDDDKKLKDNTFYQLALYQAMRQGSELGLYLPGIGSSDQLRLFSSPTALSTTAERLVKLTGNVMPWNIMDEYTTTTKWHKKGDNKLVANMAALLGMNNMDPEKVLFNFSRLY